MPSRCFHESDVPRGSRQCFRGHHSRVLFIAVLAVLPPALAAFGLGAGFPRRVPVIARLRASCSSLVHHLRRNRAARGRHTSPSAPTPVWKMQLSGRQEYYLEQEQAWEREVERECPSVVAAVKAAGGDAGARSCAKCSAALTSAAVTCGRCLAASASFCSEKCHREAWSGHKFWCSEQVEVRRSAMGDGLGVFARRAFGVGEELVRERPLVVLADEQV